MKEHVPMQQRMGILKFSSGQRKMDVPGMNGHVPTLQQMDIWRFSGGQGTINAHGVIRLIAEQSLLEILSSLNTCRIKVAHALLPAFHITMYLIKNTRYCSNRSILYTVWYDIICCSSELSTVDIRGHS
mmetsp:Transcript_24598/g.36457  ORF Transcript_24598/g.36457 Transcript_24598/m.36457 type:complete len:129 (-) Transcript_24598:37-423(-)